MSTLQFLRMPAVRAALGVNENRSVLAACAKYSIPVARRPNAISALGNAPINHPDAGEFVNWRTGRGRRY
jgi:hypothetical protein